MDQGLVVDRLMIALGALAGAAVGVPAAIWLVGRACRRRGWPSGLVFAAQALTPVVVFYAASIAFDLSATTGEAVVERKDERITYGTQIPGGWNRSYWATVRIAASDGPTPSLLWLGEATFDALHPDVRVAVHYWPAFPHLGRLAGESTTAWVPWTWLAWAAGVIALGRGVWHALASRPAIRVVLAFVAVAGGVVWWVFPTPWDAPLAQPVVDGTAEVRQVRDVTRAFVSGRRTGHIDAPQPWQLVELQFVPEGRTEPVIAIDGVDLGSVRGLTVGARVPIRYRADAPREARLHGARTYRWREWLELGEYLLLLVATVAAIVLLGRLVSMLWRRATTR